MVLVLAIRPITLKTANAFVAQHHRHNQPTNGHKWSVACYDGARLCGVAIAGQPVARRLDDGLTIEISYAEIAEMCGCTKGSVQTSINAARKIFRKFLK